MAKNVVVIGGSYVGLNLAESLAKVAEGRFRVLLVEKNSHFQHLFAFPRYAVTTSIPTHKAFIPYQVSRLGQNGSIIQASVTDLTKSAVQLDRNISLDGQQTDNIPYFALAIATGTKLTPPSTLPGYDKLAGTAYLRKHASEIERSNRIAIIGAGAVGVQMATDIKELFPDKEVTLIHSRDNTMSRFHAGLHELVRQRNEELGIKMILGKRVKLPKNGYPFDQGPYEVELLDGTTIPTDFAVICTGQTPQSEVLRTLARDCIDVGGFIKVRDTLQLQDERFPNVFSLGDIAATAAPKAARPAMKQSETVTKNVLHLLSNEPLEKYEVTDPAAIHLTLGIAKSVIFRNPSAASNNEPVVMHKDDGKLDMGIDGVWARRGADITNAML